ncbi:MAG: GNAT family N-acetyltransferase [Tissierellales bacterium]
MKIYSLADIPKDKLIEFFKLHWGSTKMVISSGVYDCSELDGFAVLNENGDIIGLVTYIIRDNECEIISLDSILEGKGIGTSLINEVENIALKNNCKLIKVITTNDNLSALRFYQKRGFVLSRIINNAVEKAREIKPEIPLIGNDGIPIRDEIELIKILN